jgi:amino acid transporter
MLLFYTIVTMCGGNPQGDAFGFRYWRDPGSFREYINGGSLGRFQGVLATIIGAAFVIAGPEYISMVGSNGHIDGGNGTDPLLALQTAGEAKNPRKTMPRAFSSITYRLVFFFIAGAISVGVLCPYDAPELVGASGVSAANSPYVISVSRNPASLS